MLKQGQLERKREDADELMTECTQKSTRRKS